jgi:hypothetical protein
LAQQVHGGTASFHRSPLLLIVLARTRRGARRPRLPVFLAWGQAARASSLGSSGSHSHCSPIDKQARQFAITHFRVHRL